MVERILDCLLDDLLSRSGGEAVLSLALEFGLANEHREHAAGADHHVFASDGRRTFFLADAGGVLVALSGSFQTTPSFYLDPRNGVSYNVYGDRADMAYASKITNRTVMDREMEILDIKTANRDKRVLALAQGKDAQVDDSNLPPVTKMGTNHPGPAVWAGAATGG